MPAREHRLRAMDAEAHITDSTTLAPLFQPAKPASVRLVVDKSPPASRKISLVLVPEWKVDILASYELLT
jgi:hypothetical protein